MSGIPLRNAVTWDRTDPRAARRAIRSGGYTGYTAAIAAGYVQANICILPRDWSADFLLYCQRNSKPCPLIARSDVGNPRLPTLAVEISKYEPSQVALDFGDYPAWREAWQKIASPVERGYHLFCLLSGARPGEAARLTRADIDADRGMFKITNAKGGKDINLPISPQIAFSLAMAVDAVDAGKVKVFRYQP